MDDHIWLFQIIITVSHARFICQSHEMPEVKLLVCNIACLGVVFMIVIGRPLACFSACSIPKISYLPRLFVTVVGLRELFRLSTPSGSKPMGRDSGKCYIQYRILYYHHLSVVQGTTVSCVACLLHLPPLRLRNRNDLE